MTFKDRINDSIVWWSLGLVVLGFAAGFSAYSQLMSISGLYLPKEKVEKEYIKSDVVASQYFPRKCAIMANYPIGVWRVIQPETEADIGKNYNPIRPTPITLTDAAHGTWVEGLGKAENGKYPETKVAPLTIAPPISAGKPVVLTMTHAPDLANDSFADRGDREFTETQTLLVNEDGCFMSGSFTSSAGSGTVAYCWDSAQLHGLCPLTTIQSDAGPRKR